MLRTLLSHSSAQDSSTVRFFSIFFAVLLGVFGPLYLTGNASFAQDDNDLSGWLEEDLDVELGDGNSNSSSKSKNKRKSHPDASKDSEKTADIMHAELFNEDQYPSADKCATCHERQYREWSVSPHAYAQLSPSNATQNIALLAHFNSTIGDFCARCHTPVGMELGEDPRISNMDRAQAAVEGVTCIVCHRVNTDWGLGSDARFFFEKGDVHAPVFSGGSSESNLEELIASGELGLAPTENDLGRPVHEKVETYEGLRDPKFCMQCHTVHLLNDANVQKTTFEYKDSPAAKKGITCVDCHMGKVPGRPEGFDVGPAAVVAGVPTPNRELINHHNAGPDASLVHPGLFPFNPKATALASMHDWVTFDVEAGWGTDAFEKTKPAGYEFPWAWSDVDDRYAARKIIEENLELLEWSRKRRLALWREGFRLDAIELEEASIEDGLEFKMRVWNGTEGHSVPSGFAMDRPVWLEVTVTDPDGEVVFVSGDRDPNGDTRDELSLYVRNGVLEVDEQLFTLNSMFILPAKRGSHHNQPMPIGHSAATLQFVRPEVAPANILGDPAAARFHRRGIEVGGDRWADYEVDEDLLTKPGAYDIRVRMIAQALPNYFIESISFAGFDHGMSPRDVSDKITEQAEILWERNLQVEVQ